jgi:hypothetical protein
LGAGGAAGSAFCARSDGAVNARTIVQMPNAVRATRVDAGWDIVLLLKVVAAADYTAKGYRVAQS